MKMQKYEVGKLLQEGVTRYQEGVKFGFSQSGADMCIFFNAPRAKEIESVKLGKLEIAMYTKEDLIFMLFKFQELHWMDAPYSVHISKPFEFEDLAEGSGFGCTIFLVDAGTGIIKAIRYIGFSAEFSRRFKIAVLKQKEQPFDKNMYDSKIQEVYKNYSTSDIVQRADAFCKIK
ncbi:MAG: hypothetical protein WC420_03915 [Candidatus Paceibacterota bacterium]